MKEKKILKITTFIIFIFTLLFIFKINIFGSNENQEDLFFKVNFYHIYAAPEGYKLSGNSMSFIYANQNIYNEDETIKSKYQYILDDYNSSVSWSILVYIDDNEEPYAKKTIYYEEFWSLKNAYFVIGKGCAFDEQQYINHSCNRFEVVFDNVEVKKAIRFYFKYVEGYTNDGKEIATIEGAFLPCHSVDGQIYATGAECDISRYSELDEI